MSTLISSALISIATPDLDQLQAFYRELVGADPVVEIPPVYVEFRLPDLRLGLYCSHKPDYAARLGAVSLCLQVDHLDRILELPILKTVEISELRQEAHGREVDFCDPDGNRIVVHEPSSWFRQQCL